MNGLNLSTIHNAMLGSIQVRALYYGSIAIWSETVEPSKPGYKIFSTAPSAQDIEDNLNTSASRPSGTFELDMTYLSGETQMFFVLPTSWVTGKSTAKRPRILDSNGFSIGYTKSSEVEPNTITINGVEYGIYDILIGYGMFTIEF
jgi:hypothetical protein